MISAATQQEYYRALVDRDRAYDGIFYVGVTTTGVFCRPTCPARKPMLAHCEFFPNAQSALLASYRPCKRCRPLSQPDQVSPVVQQLVDAIEANPEKRWRNQDFEALSVNSATARRQFRQRFGMTFVAYARVRRLGLAMQEIRAGQAVVDAQLAVGFESGSGFRDAFARILGVPPARAQAAQVLYARWIDTPLGPMVAVGGSERLHLLEFADRRGLEREILTLRQETGAAIVPGASAPLVSIQEELHAYFDGTACNFRTLVALAGTPFQQRVWQALQQIPAGHPWSYRELAARIGQPTATRAVGRANGANRLALVIPCHRVIAADGTLGGYGGGTARKQWLLEHEQRAFGGDAAALARLTPAP